MKNTMTTKEAAEYLGIKESQLLRITYQGFVRNLPGFGKPFRYSKVDLDRYLHGDDYSSEQVAKFKRR